MEKKYRISIEGEGPAELEGHVFGYDKVHELFFDVAEDKVTATFDQKHQKSTLMGRICDFVQAYVRDRKYNAMAEEHNVKVAAGDKAGEQLKLRTLADEFIEIRSGYRASVTELIWFNLCSSTAMVAACMQEVAPDLNFSFTYLLSRDSSKNPLWRGNYRFVVGQEDLKNDFNLDVEGVGVFPINIEEAIDLEKIPKDSVKQGQETPAGTD